MMELKFSRWTASFAAAVVIMGMVYMNLSLFGYGYEYSCSYRVTLKLNILSIIGTCTAVKF